MQEEAPASKVAQRANGFSGRWAFAKPGMPANEGISIPIALESFSRLKYARQIGLVDPLAPHDMRRTCAKLCRASGGDPEQIQFLLGHASIQTTERYLGSRQNLKEAVNDRLGLD
jgi:integrase